MSSTQPLPPRGIRNNNPGNMEKGTDRWQGLAPTAQQTDLRFWIFTDPKWGLRAIAVELLTYQRLHACKSIRQLITRWAPPDPPDYNDTEAYIASVSQRVGEDADKPVNLQSDRALLRGIVLAITWQENAEQPYPSSVVDAAMRLV